jgi:hypothetical protein
MDPISEPLGQEGWCCMETTEPYAEVLSEAVREWWELPAGTEPELTSKLSAKIKFTSVPEDPFLQM